MTGRHASRQAVFAPACGPERVLPIEGLAEYGTGFKTVSEAVHLRNHVLRTA